MIMNEEKLSVREDNTEKASTSSSTSATTTSLRLSTSSNATNETNKQSATTSCFNIMINDESYVNIENDEDEIAKMSSSSAHATNRITNDNDTNELVVVESYNHNIDDDVDNDDDDLRRHQSNADDTENDNDDDDDDEVDDDDDDDDDDDEEELNSIENEVGSHQRSHQSTNKTCGLANTSQRLNGAINTTTSSEANGSKTALLSLKEILQLFNCPISQEQAWAILYQLLNELNHLIDCEFEYANANKEKIDVNSIYLDQDGSLFLGFDGRPPFISSSLCSSSSSSLSSSSRHQRHRQRSTHCSHESSTKTDVQHSATTQAVHTITNTTTTTTKIESSSTNATETLDDVSGSAVTTTTSLKSSAITVSSGNMHNLGSNESLDVVVNNKKDMLATSNIMSSSSPSPSSSSSSASTSVSLTHIDRTNRVNGDDNCSTTNTKPISSMFMDSLVEQEKQQLQKDILKSVAYLIFDALDYGNNYSNEPVLNNSLSRLLLLISGHYKQFKEQKLLAERENKRDETAHDEQEDEFDLGRDNQNDDDDDDEKEDDEWIGFDKAIDICKKNVTDCDYHYRAVCSGLYAQAYELKEFLNKIEASKNIIQQSGKDATHYCFEVLDKNDWAKLWMQVIHELRNVCGKVKLKKVVLKSNSTDDAKDGSNKGDVISSGHRQFELTPFEMLLNQIRDFSKYNLKKVTIDDRLARELKKDARDIILEFIRSRPPLRKASLRVLHTSTIYNNKYNSKTKPINLHEQLMNSIRNNSTPLRKTTNLEDLNKKKYLYKYKKKKKQEQLSRGDYLNEDDEVKYYEMEYSGKQKNSQKAACHYTHDRSSDIDDHDNDTTNDTDDDNDDGDDEEDQSILSKKLLKPDKKLLLNDLLLSSDDDDSDIDYDDLTNLNDLDIINENHHSSFTYDEANMYYLNLNNLMMNSTLLTTSHQQQLHQQQQQPQHLSNRTIQTNMSMSTSTNNSSCSSSSSSNVDMTVQKKKSLKPPESLKTPLSPWCENNPVVENWRSLINNDLFQ